uniref:RRM domain-containing protein n=1 Tax=Globodera pallida TaxID=36090 RepID=A0A183C3T0_GLOPA
MGKKNRLKQLLGRFNEETNCEIRALPYSFGGVACEIFLKVDLNRGNSLAVANVPYYLDEAALKEFCSCALGTEVVEAHITVSTALHGNLKRGYRSGRLVFSTIQARRRAFDAIGSSIAPLKLENLNVNLPAWHKPIANRLGKRRHITDEEKMEIPDEGKVAGTVDSKEPDEDGWVTVTRRHKFSFRGKINRLDGNGGHNLMDTESAGNFEESLEGPKKKKRRR